MPKMTIMTATNHQEPPFHPSSPQHPYPSSSPGSADAMAGTMIDAIMRNAMMAVNANVLVICFMVLPSMMFKM